MRGFLEILRSGAWVTPARMRLVAMALLGAYAVAIVMVGATSDGLNDYEGRPLGTDFSNVYAAGTLAREGEAAAVYDLKRHYAREQAIFGEGTPFYSWHYPPFFLLVAGALAFLPYLLALLVWQGSTLAGYLWAVGKIVLREGPSSSEAQGEPVRNRLWLLLALAFPAVFVNVGHGNNGFLTAALLGGALLFLDRRPLVAGLCFGLLAYKPQYGLMIPLVLLATARWRVAFAAATTVGAMIAVSLLAFGADAWRAFFSSLQFTREVVLEQGNPGWHKIQSVFSAVRMWGGSIGLAYALHGLVTLGVGVALARLWRSGAPYAQKAAALCVGTLLATPYTLDYDMMLLAPALAFLGVHGLRDGFAPYEKTILALVWLAPLVARSAAENLSLPLGVTAMLVAFVVCLRGAGLFVRAAPARVPEAPTLRGA